MNHLIYPGIFYNEDGRYWVEFPDLPGCQSFADTLPEIYEGAKEALYAYCAALMAQGVILPVPSYIADIKVPKNAFTSLVSPLASFTDGVVEQTLTIPLWLYKLAEKNSLIISNVLHDALVQKLVG